MLYQSVINAFYLYDYRSQCRVVFDKPITMDLEKDHLTCLIAQRLPSFDKVSLRNKCVLTCDEQKDGLGGILAFEADNLVIDSTSKIDMTGKGTSISELLTPLFMS